MSSKDWCGGELLFAGGTDWATLGRASGKTKKSPEEDEARSEKYPNLLEPTRLGALSGVKILWIAAGSAACHCIAGDASGRCFTWGRNEKGQLGHGDTIQRNIPTVVDAVSKVFAVSGAGGRNHTAIVTMDGASYCWGSNLHGQCGTGSIKTRGNVEELILKPHQAIIIENCQTVAAGIDFTMWLCDGQLFAAGCPQHGQLGDGSDHMYNAKDSAVQIKFEPVPVPQPVGGQLVGKRVTRVACGHNHTVAVDDAGAAYTWGNGGYGRLGHKVQQDEHAPRAIDTFKGRLTVPADAVVGAGSTSSYCTIVGSQLMGWGKLKASGDTTMYPQPVYDLQGWNIRSLSCGPQTFAVAADQSVITWGQATNGELGYGVNGKKSSANPAKCNALEGMHTEQVACGLGFTMFLVEPSDDKLAKFATFDSTVVEEAAPVPEGGAEGGGRGGRGGGRGGRAAAAAGSKRKAPPSKPAGGRGAKAKK